MLLDDFASRPDFSELHRVEIDAPSDAVWRALWTADLDAAGIVKTLLLLRSLPGLLRRPSGAMGRRWRLTLPVLLGSPGFGLLAEEPGREVVMGIAGRFWRPAGGVLPFERRRFLGPLPALTARAVTSFALEELGPGRTRLSTETRVVCADAAARRRFRAYWLVIRPWSGLIRILWLRAVRRACASPRAA
jgi:hypothetical protein